MHTFRQLVQYTEQFSGSAEHSHNSTRKNESIDRFLGRVCNSSVLFGTTRGQICIYVTRESLMVTELIGKFIVCE